MTNQIEHVAYEYARHCGCLVMQEGHTASMDGAVALFERLDPAVERVFAFSGPTCSAIFVRNNGTWTTR